MDRFAVELRASLEGNTLRGHAAVFGTAAKLRGHYERMAPGAFDAVLGRGPDTRALVNHDPSLILGRTAAGTLRLATDDAGLAFEVDLPDTQLGRDVRELVRRGDLDGASFGFLPGADAWTRAGDGLQVRTHTSISELVDVSLATFPAYAGTDVVLRSMDLDDRPVNLRAQLIRARARLLPEGSSL
jgi:HK97 family phage prohead protease